MATFEEKIVLWQGYHGAEVKELIQQCWEQNHLFIACPPNHKDFSFLPFLPDVHVQGAGSLQGRLFTTNSKIKQQRYPDWPVIGLFTSGSTRGHPRLVLLSKKNIVSCQQAILQFYDTRKISHIFCYPQPFHVFGLLLGYIMSQCQGWHLHFAAGPYQTNHHATRLQLLDYKALTLATPTHLRDLASYCTLNRCAPAASYSVLLGGAPVRATDWHLAREALNFELPSIGYGCTEAAPGITHLPPGEEPSRDGTLGYLLNGMALSKNLNNQNVVRGPNTALAIIEQGKLEFPSEIILQDTLYRDPHGCYHFEGRSDFVLNRGGEKFYLEQLEDILSRRLQIACMCTAYPHQRLGQGLAILTTQANLEHKIQESLSCELGRQFHELQVRVVPALPLNDNSKPDRKAAQAIFIK